MAVAAANRGWLGRNHARILSEALHEPPEVARVRREAAERVDELPLEPNPLYRQYGYFAGVDLNGVNALPNGPAVAVPPLGSGTVQIVHDAAGSHVRRSPDLPASAVHVTPLSELWSAGGPTADRFYAPPGGFTDRLSALSAATMNRGYRLAVDEGHRDRIRVQDIAVLSTPKEALSVRRELIAPANASLVVTEETFATAPVPDAQRLFASQTHVTVGRAARVAVLTVHAPDEKTVAIYTRRATLEGDARLTWMWNGFGGFRTKIRNLTELPGRGSDVEDLQTFFGDHQQSYDSSIQISHIGADTHGQSVTRGVFRGESRGMSRGLVRIEPEARGTLSYLSEHAMLLNKGARSDTIPILEILCRDVKATHSSSVAPVDPEKVFYLESRGMPEPSAIRMIGEGFLAHVLDRSPIGALRDLLYPHLATRWDRGEIPWDAERFPSLPALRSVAGDVGSDWRFDAKLR